MPPLQEIPFFRPNIGRLERANVLQALESGWLSGGQFTESLEDQFKTVTSRTHALAVSSGTAALDIACRLVGFENGRRVATTPLTYIASTACLVHRGARPILCDVDPSSFNMDTSALRETALIEGVLFVDLFGSLDGLSGARSLCDNLGVPLIEDSCQALGANQDGIAAGSIGDVSVFGFFPNKQITTGEGGLLAFDRTEWLAPAEQYRNQGRTVQGGRFLQDAVLGLNYKLGELSSAIGCAQMSRLSELLSLRQQRARWYIDGLSKCRVLQLPPSDAGRSWFCFYVITDAAEQREELAKRLAVKGIATKECYPPTHLHPALRAHGYSPGDFPVAESIAARVLFLPFDAVIPRQEVRRVIDAVFDITSHW